MCHPCHKKVDTDHIFYFVLSLRGTSQNPQTQPNPSAPFPPTHDAIYCFLLLLYFVFLTWRLSCHFESLGYQLHNCHQHGLSSWFLKILPVKRRLLLVSLVCFTLIFLTPLFRASGPEVLTIDNRNKMSTKRTLIQQYLPSMTHHIWKDFNPKRAKGKKKCYENGLWGSSKRICSSVSAQKCRDYIFALHNVIKEINTGSTLT